MKQISNWLLFSLLLTFFSCDNSDLKQKIQELSSQPVILSVDSMVSASILIGQLPKRNSSAEYIWVDYIDSLECTDCAVSKPHGDHK